MAEKTPAKPRRSGRAKVNEQTALAYFGAVAARDPDAMAAHWHPDGIEDFVPIGVYRGPAAVRGFFTELFTAVPDSEFLVHKVVADTQGASVQWRLTGTFGGGPFQGVEPTGRRIDMRGCDCLEVDEAGKITRNTAYYDGAAFARDIGMLPAQDSAADRAMRAGFNAVTRARAAVARRTGESS
jgi:predicted ester cyclase